VPDRDKMTAWCTTRFKALHHWPDAPDECNWLRHHEFVVVVEVGVNHDDRDVEFILLAREVDEFVDGVFDSGAHSESTTTWSCERWAREVGEHLAGHGYRVVKVKVSEEGLHGATYRPAR
jgi:6-pyruvoyl-tetrahydropterin synthase